MTVISTQHLSRRFGEKLAVNGLTMEVQQGEIFGLLGHNGAGKTTTVRLLNGVLTPSEGSATVLGLSPIEDGPQLRNRTGVLTETPSLYEQLNARDNLQIFADLYDVPAKTSKQRVNEMLTLFDLHERANEKVGGYSKGMKQRLALARAFLHEPELLFLDEPTSGLDPVAAKQVNDMIVHLSQSEKRTVVLATHNLHDAQRLCNRVAVLEQGRIVAMGTPAELVRQTTHNLTLTIEIDESQISQTLSLLQSMDGLSEVARANGGVRVSGMKHAHIPDMISKLINEGVKVYSVIPQQPSLEDVYFALHREKESV